MNRSQNSRDSTRGAIELMGMSSLNSVWDHQIYPWRRIPKPPFLMVSSPTLRFGKVSLTWSTPLG